MAEKCPKPEAFERQRHPPWMLVAIAVAEFYTQPLYLAHMLGMVFITDSLLCMCAPSEPKWTD